MKTIYKFYLPLVVLAFGVFVSVFIVIALYRHNSQPQTVNKYINSTDYEQQKDACLAGKIKCHPVASTAY